MIYFYLPLKESAPRELVLFFHICMFEALIYFWQLKESGFLNIIVTLRQKKQKKQRKDIFRLELISAEIPKMCHKVQQREVTSLFF